MKLAPVHRSLNLRVALFWCVRGFHGFRVFAVFAFSRFSRFRGFRVFTFSRFLGFRDFRRCSLQVSVVSMLNGFVF